MSWKANPKAGQQIKEQLALVLLAAAAEITSEHQKDLGEQYPPASTPGEMPARRTGNLQSSVAYEPTGVQEVIQAGLRIKVGYQRKADYITHLAKSGRLWLKHTAENMRGRLAQLGVRVRG